MLREKTDNISTNTGIREKTDNISTNTGIREKTDNISTNTGIREKIDNISTNTGIREKIDNISTNTGLREKADNISTNTGLREKADNISTNTGLREKTDNISTNTVEKTTEDFIKKKSNQVKQKSLKIMAIASSLCLVLGIGYFALKNKERIEKENARIEKENARIEELRANLPKSSSKLGCLPGNLATYHRDASNPPYIVTSNGVPFFSNGDELGSYDESSGEFNILTNIESQFGLEDFNKYGDFIYYRITPYELQKYNTITNEVSDVYGISARQVIIMDDYMYYIEENGSNNIDENWHLFKVNLIDGSKEKLLNMPINMFSINSNYILYQGTSFDDKINSLNLMNLETKETATLNIDIINGIDGAGWVALYENCILYIDENDKSLYRVNLNGNNIDIESKEKIQENIYDFTLEGQYLYFIEGDYENSKLFVKDLLSNDIYYIDDNAKRINVDGGFMEYYTDEGSYLEKFSPERYEKIEK